MARAVHAQVALTGVVPQMHCCWVLQTQSHLLVSKKWSDDTHLAAGSATHEHDWVEKMNPHPHVWVVGHLHWQVLVSKICGALHDGSAEHAHVALLKLVLQMQVGVFKQTQSHLVVSNLWRLDTHLDAGFGVHEQEMEFQTNPQPHCWTFGQTHWQVC